MMKNTSATPTSILSKGKSARIGVAFQIADSSDTIDSSDSVTPKEQNGNEEVDITLTNNSMDAYIPRLIPIDERGTLGLSTDPNCKKHKVAKKNYIDNFLASDQDDEFLKSDYGKQQMRRMKKSTETIVDTYAPFKHIDTDDEDYYFQPYSTPLLYPGVGSHKYTGFRYIRNNMLVPPNEIQPKQKKRIVVGRQRNQYKKRDVGEFYRKNTVYDTACHSEESSDEDNKYFDMSQEDYDKLHAIPQPIICIPDDVDIPIDTDLNYMFDHTNSSNGTDVNNIENSEEKLADSDDDEDLVDSIGNADVSFNSTYSVRPGRRRRVKQTWQSSLKENLTMDDLIARQVFNAQSNVSTSDVYLDQQDKYLQWCIMNNNGLGETLPDANAFHYDTLDPIANLNRAVEEKEKQLKENPVVPKQKGVSRRIHYGPDVDYYSDEEAIYDNYEKYLPKETTPITTKSDKLKLQDLFPNGTLTIPTNTVMNINDNTGVFVNSVKDNTIVDTIPLTVLVDSTVAVPKPKSLGEFRRYCDKHNLRDGEIVTTVDRYLLYRNAAKLHPGYVAGGYGDESQDQLRNYGSRRQLRLKQAELLKELNQHKYKDTPRYSGLILDKKLEVSLHDMVYKNRITPDDIRYKKIEDLTELYRPDPLFNTLNDIHEYTPLSTPGHITTLMEASCAYYSKYGKGYGRPQYDLRGAKPLNRPPTFNNSNQVYGILNEIKREKQFPLKISSTKIIYKGNCEILFEELIRAIYDSSTIEELQENSPFVRGLEIVHVKTFIQDDNPNSDLFYTYMFCNPKYMTGGLPDAMRLPKIDDRTPLDNDKLTYEERNEFHRYLLETKNDLLDSISVSNKKRMKKCKREIQSNGGINRVQMTSIDHPEGRYINIGDQNYNFIPTLFVNNYSVKARVRATLPNTVEIKLIDGITILIRKGVFQLMVHNMLEREDRVTFIRDIFSFYSHIFKKYVMECQLIFKINLNTPNPTVIKYSKEKDGIHFRENVIDIVNITSVPKLRACLAAIKGIINGQLNECFQKWKSADPWTFCNYERRIHVWLTENIPSTSFLSYLHH